jgi:transcriptional regulator with XRE-family HTH domain
MTQHALSEATGMPQPSIARIERGTVIPRADTLMTMLRATGYRLTIEPPDPAVDREAIRRQLATSVPRRTLQALGRRAKDPTTSPVRILRRLRLFAVPFVLIGELAEVAHGSATKVGPSLEVCIASTDVARERLRMAQDDLGPQAGRLRVRTETAAGETYDVLARNAVTLPIDSGVMVRVAALEDLIGIRRALGGPEDLEAAATLAAIVEETAARS